MATRDRIYIDQIFSNIHKEINAMMKDKGVSFVTKEIFMLAMSLALETPTEIKGKKYGYFLLKNLRAHEINFFYLCAWHSLKGVDKMADVDDIYKIAEQCANTGFKTIKRLMAENKDNFINMILLDTMNKFNDDTDDDAEDQ